jgi:protease-4
VATEDSAEALVLNPANLANLPAAEARWTGAFCRATRRVACGHAFDLATPLYFGLSTGLRVDYVIPPRGDAGPGFPYDLGNYAWVTWGVGYKVSERLQVGFSLQAAYSSNPLVDGLFGITAGLSYRPYRRFGFGLVAQDFNGPSSLLVPTAFAPNEIRTAAILDRSYTGALTFRPSGTRDVELGAELRYFEGTDNWRPRAVAAFDVPHVGRVRGDVEVQNLGNDRSRGVLGTVGAEFYLDHVSAGGGALFGSGLGSATDVSPYATISLSGARSPGLPLPEKAVSIRLEATPGTRAHVRLLRKLWHLAEDRETRAVTMVVRSEIATSYAHAEELADAFRVLKSRGKKVICSFEDAGPKSLFACASADRIVVNPAGGLRYSGLRTQHIYLAGLLEKIGVKAEFVRIGAHKAAPEQFMNKSASDVARADQEDLLLQHEAVFARNMELYRGIPASTFRAVSAKGPFVASEARDAKLVDGYAFDDELERVTSDVVGHKIRYVKQVDDIEVPRKFGPQQKVAILYIDGDIIDGRSRTVPLLDNKLVGSYTIAEAAKQLREDPTVKAVVVRIESPGGSSMAADVMWRELYKLNQAKPVIASMGSIAASGGYYVAAPARKIFALPLTITGSIGIFYGKADVSELLTKIGVNVETRKTTPRADAESLFRGFTDDERVELDRKVHQFYGVFLDRVAQGRKLTKEQVDAVGQGRVWAGQQALDHKLVDEMGGLRNALAAARAAGHLPDDAPIVEYPPVERSIFDIALGLVGLKAGAGLAVEGVPVQVREMLRAVAPLALYGDGQALARMEWMPVEDTVGIEDDALSQP